jgi:hypothetical protein
MAMGETSDEDSDDASSHISCEVPFDSCKAPAMLHALAVPWTQALGVSDICFGSGKIVCMLPTVVERENSNSKCNFDLLSFCA